MPSTAHWERPSPQVAELIRTGAEAFVSEPGTLFTDVDDAVLSVSPSRLNADPTLSAAITHTNHANILHWARANMRDPGAPVSANLGPEVLDIARDIVRRGLDDRTLAQYRVGQNIAWRAWMSRAFALTDAPDVLHELLDVTARSIFTFVDETVAGIEAQIEREREQLTRGTHAERLETVNLILEGAPITAGRASARLRYELAGRHTAVVLWSDEGTPNQGQLEQAADALARAIDLVSLRHRFQRSGLPAQWTRCAQPAACRRTSSA